MSAENGKVHKLEAVKVETENAEPVETVVPSASTDEAQRDMSKVAMIVSLLAVLLLVIFFFGMNRNIAGLTEEVKSLGVLREDVASLDQRMVKMQEDVPVQMKRLIAHDIVNEMTMKAVYLSDVLQDEAMRAKMQEVLAGLKDIRDGLEK
ncbi:hypothetical protein GM415_15105 [Pseudodesulfovibrio cashew]|uniref:Uncharacterized protein n=1 Tax=Pseudodesulfovibrio cashew TaxID=2678688 RepID=A0A6I6JMQ0_9BACT|nr:hypothetical protein [Pseudodesulfovibrio cashew]QGY41393.1 hypothetical protein GM415_15105 [Pseudodesulfovibrio cashew]